MPQSAVPNCIAKLDDARYQLEQALRLCVALNLTRDGNMFKYLSSALKQVQDVIRADAFKKPLSDGYPEKLGQQSRQVHAEHAGKPVVQIWTCWQK